MRDLFLICISFMAVAVLSGCTKPADGPTANAGTSTESGAKPTTPDDKIAQAVKDKYAADLELKGEKINVTVKDGRVTLTGTVSSDSLKIRAEDAAREVNDVFGVDAEKLVAQ